MKKILILTNLDVGLYKFRKELLAELIGQGNEVYISLPNGDLIPPLQELGCQFIETSVDRRGMNPLTDSKLLYRYWKMIKKVKPELVITYTIKPNIYGGIVSRLLKIPYAINITGLGTAFQGDGLLKRLTTFLYKAACKKSKVVFFENEGNKQIFMDNHIIREQQACLLPGAGVNLEEYPFCEYPADGTIRFLYIGRIMKEKGVDELFEAAKRIKAEYDNVFFDIVGPYEDDYQSTVEALQEQGIIQYHGYQQDVKPFIKNAHCFVLPSYHEGMANTLLECGAMGRPLITSNIHGCMEAVEDNINGYLIQAKDANDLFDKIKKLIDLPNEEKAIMGKHSRNIIEETFGKKIVIHRALFRLAL